MSDADRRRPRLLPSLLVTPSPDDVEQTYRRLQHSANLADRRTA